MFLAIVKNAVDETPVLMVVLSIFIVLILKMCSLNKAKESEVEEIEINQINVAPTDKC